MPFLVRNLILSPEEDESLLSGLVQRRFGLRAQDVVSCRLVRKSIDARRKPRVKFICTVECRLTDEAGFLARFGTDPDVQPVVEPSPPTFPTLRPEPGIVIVGMGPAGLFTALRLAEYGLVATLVERGQPVERRTRDVELFWRSGALDPESNVQFGEGGAGTFSDGKLTTRVNDRNITYILGRLVTFGAPVEILYQAKPHIGTDRLRRVVAGIRQWLLDAGFEIRFACRASDILVREGQVAGVVLNDHDELSCSRLVLAPGHSARDTYRLLAERGVFLEAKPFAIGARIEHPQELINRIQYGKGFHPALPPAEYALAYNDRQRGRSAYSFCMCPGGVVVAGSSEQGGVVTNGMSAYRRDATHANSALVVNVGPADFADPSPLAGIAFQQLWERRAFAAGGGDYRAPAQNLLAFLGQRGGGLTSSYRPGVRETDLATVLPAGVTETLRAGIHHFEGKMRGFITAEATLTGVETRTSAPVRIVRGDDFQSVTLRGLYPAGEGAGYAGGIMSAALDGIRVADALAQQLSKQQGACFE